MGMVSGPALLPYANMVGLVTPNILGRAPFAVGALGPAMGVLVVSMPNNHYMLYLVASPKEFPDYSSFWPALYTLAMQLVDGSFQPGPRYSSLETLQFHLEFSTILSFIERETSATDHSYESSYTGHQDRDLQEVDSAYNGTSIAQEWSTPATCGMTNIPSYTAHVCTNYILAQVQELPYDLIIYADDLLLMAQPGDVPTDARL